MTIVVDFYFLLLAEYWLRSLFLEDLNFWVAELLHRGQKLVCANLGRLLDLLTRLLHGVVEKAQKQIKKTEIDGLFVTQCRPTPFPLRQRSFWGEHNTLSMRPTWTSDVM